MMNPQQPYYDQWGRPIMPPPQQQPQSISPHLESRFQKMEQMIYGGYPNANNQSGNSGGNFGNSQTAQQTATPHSQNTLIPVSSFDEAWNKPPDYSGAKQYYINEAAGEIYVIYVDSNIDKVKDVYKKETPQTFMDKPQQTTDPLMPVMERLTGIESEVFTIKTMLESAAPIANTPTEPPATKTIRGNNGRYQKKDGAK